MLSRFESVAPMIRHAYGGQHTRQSLRMVQPPAAPFSFVRWHTLSRSTLSRPVLPLPRRPAINPRPRLSRPECTKSLRWQSTSSSSQSLTNITPAPSGDESRTSSQSQVQSRSENLPLPPRPPSLLSRFLPGLSPSTAGVSSSSFLKIVKLAGPEKKPLAAAIGLLLISSTVSMSVPLTVGKLIDFFSSANPQIPFGLTLTQAAALLLTAFTAGALANTGRAFLMRMASQRIVARLRVRTYSSALKQEIEYVEKGEGDVISRLSADTSIVGESVTQNLSDGLRAAVMSSVGLGAMFYLSPHLTMLMLAVVPPVSLGAVFYGRYIKQLANRTQEALGEMTKVAQESLAALRTVQAFNSEAAEGRKFQDRVNHVLALARKEAVASALFFGSTGWSGNVTLLALLGYGGSLVSKGAISVGDLTSLLMYTAYVGSGLQMMTSFFSSIMRGIGAGARIFDLIDRHPVIDPEPSNAIKIPRTRQGTISFRDVTFEYPSRPGAQILQDFNLDVKVGESVAIVGSSGSGKSSVISLLLRFYDPVKGKLMYDGQDVRDFTPASWRDVIGVVPQDPILFTGTIASNIKYGNESATRQQIEDAARQANCDFVWGMPKGFDTEIGRLSLSGGQRQRLVIARALLKKPSILIFDEASSNLDATSENRVNDAIGRILRSEHTTCIMVAHRLSTIARAERIVVLEGGRITESGTYRELVERPDSRFRALMADQLVAAQAGVRQFSDAAEPDSEPEPEVVVERAEDEPEERADGDNAKAESIIDGRR